MSAFVEADCPGCQKKCSIPSGALGRQVKCPHCQRVFAPAEKPGGDVWAVPLVAPQSKKSVDRPFPKSSSKALVFRLLLWLFFGVLVYGLTVNYFRISTSTTEMSAIQQAAAAADHGFKLMVGFFVAYCLDKISLICSTGK